MKTFRAFVNDWHNVSAYIAAAVALCTVFIADNILLKLQLASISIIFLHFFEEFGFPGGFPYMGVKVLLRSNETDSSKWGANQLCSMFGNWFFAFAIYILPLILPSVRFLLIGAMMFNVAEVVMHLILFNVKQKSLYNAGLVTAVFGLGPIACYYFAVVFDASFFMRYDYVIALLWMICIFWFSFRSPLYWKLGKKEGYPFSQRTAFGYNK